MSLLIPFTPRNKGPFLSIKQDLNRLLDDLWTSGEASNLFSDKIDFVSPAIDMSETDNEAILQAELPGIDEKDLSLELNNNTLILKGEKKIDRTEKGKNFHVVERQSGSFTRMMQLPFEIDQDKITANFSNGILTVKLPKSIKAQEKVKKIEISRSEADQ